MKPALWGVLPLTLATLAASAIPVSAERLVTSLSEYQVKIAS